jgi:hypothetical protein
MQYTQRHIELNAQFRLDLNARLDNKLCDIRFFTFKSQPLSVKDNVVPVDSGDEKINENLSFSYPVFIPAKMKQTDKAILLMHGLNERNWNKYLTWAEYLCKETGKAVILFPIAFHINRSPMTWSDPRSLLSVLELRRKRNGEDRSLSFANVAFSERISEKPSRFYSSGRQSYYDLAQLIMEIKQGKHPIFKKNTQVDIFAYSIGAFLSEITMIANPNDLFSDSKLFLFCGGGIFSSMFGESRCIMDKIAFEKLFQYYMHDFNVDKQFESTHDVVYDSFNCMISSDRAKVERVSFFNNLGSRLKGISLLQDKVMPYNGLTEAMDNKCAISHFELLDFSYIYSHENPFPIGKNVDERIVDNSFTKIFSVAAQFLS